MDRLTELTPVLEKAKRIAERWKLSPSSTYIVCKECPDLTDDMVLYVVIGVKRANSDLRQFARAAMAFQNREIE